MASEPAVPATNSPKFEQALRELETTMRELEDGSTTLDEALMKYEKGVSLIRQCYLALSNAEQRIKELTGIGADGKPELKDFQHVSAIEKSKPARRKSSDSEDSEY